MSWENYFKDEEYDKTIHRNNERNYKLLIFTYILFYLINDY